MARVRDVLERHRPTGERHRLELRLRRAITDDVARLVAFYEHVTGIDAAWATQEFAELRTGTATLAIGHSSTIALFGPDVAHAASNHSAIIEFLVEDVDADHRRLAGQGQEFVQEPTTMPWGNRSILLRDPDGNLVTLFAPVSEQAVAKFLR